MAKGRVADGRWQWESCRGLVSAFAGAWIGHTESATAKLLAILRNLRVHALGPGINSASKVVHFRESGLAQELHRLRAPAAHFAMSYDLAAGIQFVHATRQIVQRNKGSAEIADLVFIRLAPIENKKIVPCIQTALEFLNLHLGSCTVH